MASPFLEKVAARSGITVEEASVILKQLTASFEESISRNGEAFLPGLGRFTPEGDELKLDPEPDLAELANFRFGHLDPVPVAERSIDVPSGAVSDLERPDTPHVQHEAFPPTAEGGEDEPVQHVDESADAGTELIQANDGVAPDEIPERGGDGSYTEVSLASGPAGKDADESRQEGMARPEMASEISDSKQDISADSKVPVANEQDVSSGPSASDDRPGRGSEQPERRRSSAPWIVLATFLILLVGAGLYLYLTDDPASNGSHLAEQTGPDNPDLVDPRDNEQVNAEDSDAELPEEEEAITETDAPGEASSAAESPPESPLFGESIDRSTSRYTLVVASLPSESSARQAVETWRQQGFRADVFAETVGGQTRYRVGVGQFESAETADSVRAESDVADQLPQGTWVYRYPARPAN
ncbi:MAG: SPOR domain-containing protein [Rhodothermales bacterium]